MSKELYTPEEALDKLDVVATYYEEEHTSNELSYQNMKKQRESLVAIVKRALKLLTLYRENSDLSDRARAEFSYENPEVLFAKIRANNKIITELEKEQKNEIKSV